MLESQFRQQLCVRLRKEGCLATPIESVVTPGFFDVIISHGNYHAFVELKVIQVPFRGLDYNVGLTRWWRPEQLSFYKSWLKAGNEALFVIRYEGYDIKTKQRVAYFGIVKHAEGITTYGDLQQHQVTYYRLDEVVEHLIKEVTDW